jgi:hypothetical protein
MVGRAVPFRMSERNEPVLEKGLRVSFMRIAKGVDGVYELEIESADPDALPDSSPEPAVPLAHG